MQRYKRWILEYKNGQVSTLLVDTPVNRMEFEQTAKFKTQDKLLGIAQYIPAFVQEPSYTIPRNKVPIEIA